MCDAVDVRYVQVRVEHDLGQDHPRLGKRVRAGATVRLPRTRVLSIEGRKFRENFDGKALTCAAVCEGLVDGDKARRAFRIADREVERPVGEPLHADLFAWLSIVSLRAGWYGVAVVVLAAEVDDDLVLDEDLIPFGSSA